MQKIRWCDRWTGEKNKTQIYFAYNCGTHEPEVQGTSPWQQDVGRETLDDCVGRRRDERGGETLNQSEAEQVMIRWGIRVLETKLR